MNRPPAIARLWQPALAPRQSLMWAMLTPLSAFYACILRGRARWWRRWARAAPVATISVGNLTVGGNGKTPFTLFLAERLRHRGYRVAIVSRGYGRRGSSRTARLVADGSTLLIDPASGGDEPALMAHTFDGPIAVARRRLDAIRLLTGRTPLDAVILDDAFQHLRLRRDLDFVLLAAPRGIGNGWLLPAGPLREPLDALGRAGAVVLVARESSADFAPSPALRAALARCRVLRATVRPRALVGSRYGVWTESPLDLGGRRIAAVSGIAEPAGFAAMLRGRGAELVATLEYPDHHHYSSADWDEIRRAAASAEVLLTTEKDLVKLERFSPPLASLYAVRLELVMSDADEAELIGMVAAGIDRRASRTSGSAPPPGRDRDAALPG